MKKPGIAESKVNIAQHREAIKQIIRQAIQSGRTELRDILPLCEGAVQAIVGELMASIIDTKKKSSANLPGGAGPRQSLSSPPFDNIAPDRHHFRSAMADFYCELPAPNPESAQWWFDLNTVEKLVWAIAKVTPPDGNVLCIGAPTIAFGLAMYKYRVTVLDNDEHLGRALTRNNSHINFQTFDAAGDIHRDRDKDEQLERQSTIFVDPPWYAPSFGAFFENAFQVLKSQGQLFFTLPPRLTRPTAEKDRTAILDSVLAAKLEIIAIERGMLTYIVPEFERFAYRPVKGFNQTGSWRVGDLVQCVARSGIDIPSFRNSFVQFSEKKLEKSKVTRFARNPNHYRIFIRRWEDSVDAGFTGPDKALIKPAVDYQQTVSAAVKAGESACMEFGETRVYRQQRAKPGRCQEYLKCGQPNPDKPGRRWKALLPAMPGSRSRRQKFWTNWTRDSACGAGLNPVWMTVKKKHFSRN